MIIIHIHTYVYIKIKFSDTQNRLYEINIQQSLSESDDYLILYALIASLNKIFIFS